MSSPVKEDLPRLAEHITAEIVGEHKLKPTETQEKTVLPNADDIAAEKSLNNHLKGITSFPAEQLNHAETIEKNALPTKEEIEAEKQAKE